MWFIGDTSGISRGDIFVLNFDLLCQKKIENTFV